MKYRARPGPPSDVRNESAVIRQFLRFAMVGVLATLTTYVVLIALVEGLGFDAVWASAWGYLSGAILNYLLNYYYTFGSSRRHAAALSRFALIILAGFLLNTAIMYGAVTVFAIHYLLAQLLAVTVVLLWSFLANRYWTFT